MKKSNNNILVNYKEVYTRLKAARVNSNMTMEQISEKISISPRYYAELESERLNGFSVPVLVGLCKTLNISVDYLLFGSLETEDVRAQAFIETLKNISSDDFDAIIKIANIYISKK